MTSQRAIILLSCCLGICLFALGFLLGRESNRARLAVVTEPAAEATAVPETTPMPAPAPPTPLPATPPSAAPVAPSKQAEAPAGAVPPIAAPTRVAPVKTSVAAADDSANQQAIARYFREVDRLQDMDVADPEASASALIGAATSGDTSGLQKLVSQARDTEQQVRAITPPEPCAHYHEQLLSLLADSRSMLQRLERGIGGGDLGSLPALMSQANSAKSRSEALEREAREIKRRYGVAL